MPRTIVPSGRARAVRGTLVRGPAGDATPEKLVKYVPAEAIAFFLPATAALGPERRVLLAVVTLIAAIGALLYLWLTARRLERHKRPLGYFYPLALLAFLAWAVGTSRNVAGLVHLDDISAGIVLLMAVFIVPLADDALATVLPLPRRTSHHH